MGEKRTTALLDCCYLILKPSFLSNVVFSFHQRLEELAQPLVIALNHKIFFFSFKSSSLWPSSSSLFFYICCYGPQKRRAGVGSLILGHKKTPSSLRERAPVDECGFWSLLVARRVVAHLANTGWMKSPRELNFIFRRATYRISDLMEMRESLYMSLFLFYFELFHSLASTPSLLPPMHCPAKREMTTSSRTSLE